MVFDAPPAQAAAHAWMPSSPCGPGCIEPIDQVGIRRVAARLVGVAGVLVSFPAAHVVTPRGKRELLQRRYARMLLGCLGMRLRIVDNRAVDEHGVDDEGGATLARGRFGVPGRGVLIVTGHISWTDIVVLASVQPLGFVARADMVDWPLLGGLAKLMRVVPIERERLRALPDVVAAIGARLAAGERIGVFPEGTTWCGRAYGTMRPALFQAAVDTGTPVQPVRLRYLDRHGAPCTVPGFVGVDTFVSSARRVLRSRGMIAEVVLEPTQYPGTDRRHLARRCEAAVRGTERSRHDALDAAVWIEAANTRVQDPSLAADAPKVRRPRLRPTLRGRRNSGDTNATGWPTNRPAGSARYKAEPKA
ncbi:1-acyl-sn-glycerol-3-phosphate acyltransferase [Nocardia sp. NBC_00881]|uniref:lysophospholipid acyltransferase family protein n=1 Tax=Nocardia sp. NBC_00881 TaxID=2975995 RepID=UPI00386749B0|nr:1-acyl-sn-glycerol-3-phosphate acyltransferase [Nocardia sp. NBC_00881]